MEDLRSFTFSDPYFYEPLDSYRAHRDYYDAVRAILPEDWTVRRDGIWLGAHPPRHTLPPQGFKIHVSATASTAVDVIRRVVPLLVEDCVPFKTAADPNLLRYLNSKRAARGSSGKFMTIYPDQEAFVSLIDEVARRTEGLEGPYILSDRRHPDSKAVFYRYGGFQRKTRPAPDGAPVHVIETPGGELVDDERTPFFRLPPWVKDPFPADEQPPTGPVVLNGRYEVVDALAFSNAGGVYKARDLTTGTELVLKEARPLTNDSLFGAEHVDSVSILEHEYSVLRWLEHTGAVVRPLGFFREWEHAFLAEEIAPGEALRSFRGHDRLYLGAYRPERVIRFSIVFREVATNLVESVRRVHEAGVVLADLSPNNVFVDPDTFRVTLIDVESAHRPDDAVRGLARTWFTPGFRPHGPFREVAVSAADDLYAVAMCLFSMIHPFPHFFELEPNAAPRFIQRFLQAGLPLEAAGVLDALCNGDADGARDLLASWTAVQGEPILFDPSSPSPYLADEVEVAPIA